MVTGFPGRKPKGKRPGIHLWKLVRDLAAGKESEFRCVWCGIHVRTPAPYPQFGYTEEWGTERIAANNKRPRCPGEIQ